MKKILVVFALALAVIPVLSGCSFISSTGPGEMHVYETALDKKPSIAVINVNESVVKRVLVAQKHASFSKIFPDPTKPGYVVGRGDVLQVTVWEAPPAMLFGMGQARSSAGMTQLPDEMVSTDGTITIPFAGTIAAAGKTTREIGREIVRKLKGLANDPQVLVRVARNVTENVTVLGAVGHSTLMPLTAKGERLLDAIAAAGGPRGPVNKITIRLSRDGQEAVMPLADIIKKPKQNIRLAPGDIIMAQFQPLSFTALGAMVHNADVKFEATGISVAEALGRVGGLDDRRSNPAAVFIFRFENPAAVSAAVRKDTPAMPNGKIPVIYRFNLDNPKTFLLAQNFPMANKDVMYISDAPATDLQKFLNILYSATFSAVSLHVL